MKILMLTPYVPYPPSSGGQIRTLNILKYLSKKHQITLVALYKNDTERQYMSHLKRYCKKIYLCRRPSKPWQLKNILKAVFSSLPFLVVRNFSLDAKQVVETLLKQEQFDVIHAETFYIMPHIPHTITPIVLAEQTIEYEVYLHYINTLPFLIRMVLYLDILKLKYWERFYWRKANIVAAVSNADENIIHRLEPNIKTVIVPNGAGDDMIVKKLETKNLRNPVVVFQGNFNWLQNVEAAKYLISSIYPHLKKKIPNIKLVISGQTAQKIKYESDDNIKIINIPPHDTETVKKVFSEATLFITPIFGPGGTRLKILAAMGSGIPVISSPTGVEGLEVQNNIHVLIANNIDEFSQKTANILSKKKLYQSVREKAYELVKEKYSWEVITQQLELIYRNLKVN
jgi:polysaccharide biosynthesis protein PslH